ncbi:MAG: DUF1330 domain-containing protein [Alphaproteobacteria bacterium]|jgi:uncharacterized protein (DUF1330 family)
MKKAYWITCYRSISDPDKLAAYAALALPAIEAAGGTFLARGMPSITKEEGEENRTVLVEFPNIDVARAAYDSPGYKEALAALGDSAVRDIRLIESV